MELGRDVFNFRIPLWCIFTIAQSHNQSRLPRAVMTLAASIRDNSSASAASTLLQSHNSTISYFHNFTISQFITVVQVESVDIHYCLFHCQLPERQGPDFRPALHRIAEAQRSVYNPSRGSVGIVPNICLWRNGMRRRNRIMEAAQ